MNIVLITGSAGLIGSESVKFFADKFDLVIGIDNDYRSVLFGEDASTLWNQNSLVNGIPNYKHYNVDIRDYQGLEIVGDYRVSKKFYIAGELGNEDKTVDDSEFNVKNVGRSQPLQRLSEKSSE